MEGDDHGNMRKKMKIDEGNVVDRDEEEEKVKEFFALIRSTREVRDLLRSNSNNGSKDPITGVWNPTFRPEDFLDLDLDHTKKKMTMTSPPPHHDLVKASQQSHADGTGPELGPGPSGVRERGEEEKEKHDGVSGTSTTDLDLNLSL